MNELLPPGLVSMLKESPVLNRAYLVGGCVRDWLWGMSIGEIDIEVYGVGYEELVRELSRWGRADLVGRCFGVVKLAMDGQVFDFSIPRRDSKVGVGHKGFEVELDPEITMLDAVRRRDFTINALMYDPRERRVMDWVGGRSDVEARILRHTSAAFVEDPLRVLRGMQFVSRFRLTVDPSTRALCESIRSTFSELARERVRDEWVKWATRSVEPSRGLRFLRDTGWLGHFPELAAIVGVEQDPEWHPEGDVFVHTGHCLDVMATLPGWLEGDSATRQALMFGVLLHDVGKSRTTHRETRDGQERWVSPGHEGVGSEMAAVFLERLQVLESIRERAVALVAQHMAHCEEPTPRAIRRLANRLAPATIDDLAWVMTADAWGRPPKPKVASARVEALLRGATALALEKSAPRPLLLGRHLIQRGWKPGPVFGEILAAGFEAQLDGEFWDLPGAETWLDAYLSRRERGQGELGD